jgi:hypothetical protein
MGLQWYEDHDPNPPPTLAEVAKDKLAEKNQRWLAKTQERIFAKAAGVLESTLAFEDIDPADELPPAEWIVALGQKEAMKRFRVAKAAWLNAKEAPVGIKVAKECVVGISKALGAESQAPKILNMQAVQISLGPAPEFPKVRIDR